MSSIEGRTPVAQAVGSELRRIRLARRMSGREFAGLLGINQSTLSRIENGHSAIARTFVLGALAHLGVADEERARILDMMRPDDDQAWLARGSALPKALEMLIQFERSAQAIVDVSPLLVPGLLQTRAYATAVFESSGTAPGLVEERVNIRIRRKAALDKAVCEFLLDEAVLVRPVGGHAVMAEQLDHVADIAEAGRAAVRILPFDVGGTVALNGGWVILTGHNRRPAVHLEHLRSGIWVFSEADIAAFELATATVRRASLDEERSVQLVRGYAKRHAMEET
ncbi:helix-turn-helix domain-containing protein [Actinoalloteichus caeruleus]|uniref:helix-turn-helix domain-containing protein n=1 Tax=Actinoalloteichus cyanogriseus TaxID=2893586 RepID=UPI0012DF8081|nr:helix-turn-helix transcriptional regulator [Actinoalloteichus caeruleus]